MPIISLLNPKGGSGKTTLSTNFAIALHRRGYSVLLVDTDPQGSARDWFAASEDNPLSIIAMDIPAALKTLPKTAKGYDFTIIDGAAKIEEAGTAALVVSDLVLLPVQPSPYDIWALSDFLQIVKTRQEVTDGKPPAAFVVSAAVAGTRLVREAVDVIEESGVPMLQATTTRRQVYPQTAMAGASVYESDNVAAIAEIDALTDEVLAMIEEEVAA